MTRPIYCRHSFACSPERFWEIYWDPEFNTELRETIGLRELTLLSEEHFDDRIERVVRTVPDRELPAAVRRVARGAGPGYNETRIWWKERRLMQWSVVSDLMPDRVRCSGYLRALEEDGGCYRELDGSVGVSVMGIGGVLERTIAADVVAGFETSAALVRRWL